MAYSKLYERINFVNESEGKTTPLGAVNMNKLDYAVDALDDRVVELDKNKLEKSSIDSLVADISYEKDSGELTVLRANSLSKKIDLGTSEILEKVNDVSKEVEDLNKKTDEIIENIGIKNTATGETIHVTDSADSKVIEFGLHGKAEQKQYSGKNLLDTSAITHGYPDATSGASISDIVSSTRYAHSEPIEINEPLTIQWKANSGLDYIRYFLYKDDVYQSQVNLVHTSDGTHTIPVSDSYDKMLLVVGTTSAIGTWDNSYLVDCQIESGTTATTYEPYTGGIASPSPDYPQDIEVAGASGSVEVKSVGKNQCNPINTHLFYDSNNLIIENTSVHSKVAKVNPNSTVMISKSNATNRFQILGCAEYPTVGGTCKMLGSFSTDLAEAQVTIPSDVNYIFVYYLYSSTETPIDIQVEEGTIATPFEAFKESTSLISTPDGLASVGGVYDEIIKYADGSGKRIQRIFKEVLNGSEDWSLNTVNSYGIANFNTKPKKAIATAQMSSHFVYDGRSISVVDTPSFNITSVNIFLRMKSSDISDVDSLKTWLASNNVTVLYALAEPIETDLTAEEIAEIEKLHTFYPVTNISNDANCNMAFKYLCDSKNYIDNKFALIEAAMVNNI